MCCFDEAEELESALLEETYEFVPCLFYLYENNFGYFRGVYVPVYCVCRLGELQCFELKVSKVK